MTYKAALDYMFAQLPMYHRVGAAAYKKDLSNTLALCHHLGNPQEKFKTVHVAGTNGKGTTSHLIAAMLQAQGYRVGLYTSPHYKDFRERIKINGQLLPKRNVARFIEKNQSFIEEIQPSFFEITVGMAFDYFANQNVDIAVIEVGLGGRLDSTNVIQPLISVITNISFDHVSMLGDTLPAIASEKAGIIKWQTPVLIGERQGNEVTQVFVEKARELESPLTFADEMVTLHNIVFDNKGLQSTVQIEGWDPIKAVVPIYGPFQVANLRTALGAIVLLSKVIAVDIPLAISKLVDFQHMVNYLGRWQYLGHTPEIIADSAHNEGGLRLVFDTLKTMEFQTLHIVCGFVNDKDLGQVLALFPREASYYFCKANIPRGLDAKELLVQAQKFGLQGKAFGSVKAAFNAAKRKANPADLVFIGGSIFVVAEVI